MHEHAEKGPPSCHPTKQLLDAWRPADAAGPPRIFFPRCDLWMGSTLKATPVDDLPPPCLFEKKRPCIVALIIASVSARIYCTYKIKFRSASLPSDKGMETAPKPVSVLAHIREVWHLFLVLVSLLVSVRELLVHPSCRSQQRERSLCARSITKQIWRFEDGWACLHKIPGAWGPQLEGQWDDGVRR